jgi:hypothetical protein
MPTATAQHANAKLILASVSQPLIQSAVSKPLLANASQLRECSVRAVTTATAHLLLASALLAQSAVAGLNASAWVAVAHKISCSFCERRDSSYFTF